MHNSDTRCRHTRRLMGPQPPSLVVLGLPRLQERCQCASVCSNWRAIIYSAAAHTRDQSDVPMPDTRTLPCDVCATEEQQQLKLQQCPAIRYAPSAALTLNEFAPTTMQQLTSLTRLVLVDPDVLRQQLDGEAFVHTPLKAAVPVGLQQLSRLAVLSVAMRSPVLDVAALPPSLAALHLDFSSGARKGGQGGAAARVCRPAPGHAD